MKAWIVSEHFNPIWFLVWKVKSTFILSYLADIRILITGMEAELMNLASDTSANSYFTRFVPKRFFPPAVSSNKSNQSRWPPANQHLNVQPPTQLIEIHKQKFIVLRFFGPAQVHA